MHIKQGDNVIVIAGASKGRKGKIIKALPALNKVVVEGVNIKKKHQRPRKQGEKGQVVETAYPIDASNVKKA